MGTLTVLEMEDEVRSALGGRTDLDSRLRRAVNLAQQRLARLHDFDEMEVISETAISNTGADADRFITLPTVREVYSIVLLDGANSRKLAGRTHTYMDRIYSKPDYWSRAWPREYCLWGFNIELFPLPQTQYTLRMRWTSWPLALVNDTDISQFLQKDEVLIELALSYINRTLGKDAKADAHEIQAKRLLAESQEVDRTKPDENLLPSPSDANMLGIEAIPAYMDPFRKEG